MTKQIPVIKLDTPGPDPNPIPGDVVEDSKPAHRKTKVKDLPDRLVPAPITTPDFDVPFLIDQLSTIPLESLTYSDCGLILNALSSATTKVGLTRRERQEQLDATSPQAKCETCHRTIDISKSGGFQILTVRDEHFQPKNVYFCSQNCLLGRGMPSHRTKKLPGDVGATT